MTKAERKRLCAACREMFPGQKIPLFQKALRQQRKEKQEQERLTKKEQTARIRAEVMERAAESGGCELCGGPGELEMHHLESGYGRRLRLQAVENCMGICRFCHREYHRDPLQFAPDIAEWCGAYGYPIPSRFRRAA